MNQSFVNRIEQELEEIRQAGLFKQERIIAFGFVFSPARYRSSA